MAHRIRPADLLALKLVLLCRKHGVESLPDLPVRVFAEELTPAESAVALEMVRRMLAPETAEKAAESVVARFEDLLRDSP